MNAWLTSLGILTLSTVAFADGVSTTPDVESFKRNAELCEHFAGEWDSMLPPKELRRIEAGVDKYCALAQKQRARLKTKYQGDAAALKVLDQYESVTSFSK